MWMKNVKKVFLMLALANQVASFAPGQQRTASSASTLRSSMEPPPPPEPQGPAVEYPLEPLPEESEYNMFPVVPKLETIQGGGTVRTYQMPPWATRCQYQIYTNGRPLKATVELWLGPLRRTHMMKIDSEDGRQTPYQATLKFKKMSQVLRIITGKSLEMPILASVNVPPPERAEELAENTERVWNLANQDEKQLIQGGSVSGGGGAIRSWSIPENVDSVQVVCWAKDTSKKSFRAKIELLQGPNNHKQHYTLQCGGGSQPYHAVLQTPGPNWLIRMTNLKFVEDGLFEMAVLPYEVPAGSAAVKAVPDKQWWE